MPEHPAQPRQSTLPAAVAAFVVRPISRSTSWAPGFKSEATGQPPKCRTALHTHRTAGQFVANQGCIFSIPTGIVRTLENADTDCGMIRANLGGEDAGGGVVWVPQITTDGRGCDLIPGMHGKPYGTRPGQTLSEGPRAMPCPKARAPCLC